LEDAEMGATPTSPALHRLIGIAPPNLRSLRLEGGSNEYASYSASFSSLSVARSCSAHPRDARTTVSTAATGFADEISVSNGLRHLLAFPALTVLAIPYLRMDMLNYFRLLVEQAQGVELLTVERIVPLSQQQIVEERSFTMRS
jgi:hypothetical protein